MGRFLNADVYASTGTGFNGFNMYAYCNNNPIIYTDKNGTSIGGFLLIAGGCLILLGTVAGAIFGYNSTEKLIDINKETKNKPSVTNNTIDANNKQNSLDNSYNTTNITGTQSELVQKNAPIQTELTFGDKMLNTVIVAGVGMAISGATVAMIGAIGVIVQAATICPVAVGLASRALFAMGAISFDMAIFVIGPMFGLSTEPIEGIKSNNGV